MNDLNIETKELERLKRYYDLAKSVSVEPLSFNKYLERVIFERVDNIDFIIRIDGEPGMNISTKA